MNSLQGRLHLGLSSALILLMVLLWWLAANSLNHIAEQMVVSRLEHDGEALLASLQRDSSASWYLKESQVGHIYQRIFSGHYYTISVEGQQLRSRSLWDIELPQPDVNLGEPLISHLNGPENQQLLAWNAAFINGDQSVVISVAEDITPMLNSLRSFAQSFALTALIILMLLLLLQRWLIRRSFKRNFFTEQFHEKRTVLLMQKKIESLSKILTHIRFIIPSDMEIFFNLCLPHFRKLDVKSQANLLKYFIDDVEEKLFEHEREQCRKQCYARLKACIR